MIINKYFQEAAFIVKLFSVTIKVLQWIKLDTQAYKKFYSKCRSL